jgi:hypothetical protein
LPSARLSANRNAGFFRPRAPTAISAIPRVRARSGP